MTTRNKKSASTEGQAKPTRDNSGRFLPGHAEPGPGRPPVRAEREYMEATMSACNPVEWARIVRQALDECSHKDFKVRNAARNFLLKALFGSSPDIVNSSNVIVNLSSEERNQVRLEIIRELADFIRLRDREELSGLAVMIDDYAQHITVKERK